jgi:hypothetical protein
MRPVAGAKRITVEFKPQHRGAENITAAEALFDTLASAIRLQTSTQKSRACNPLGSTFGTARSARFLLPSSASKKAGIKRRLFKLGPHRFPAIRSVQRKFTGEVKARTHWAGIDAQMFVAGSDPSIIL